MNTPIKPNAQDTRPPVDEQRRRLTKGGLVAPVVIGTLLSRPVLGAAPYWCTISGQLSGNTSAHGPNDQNCILGVSPTTWITKTSTIVNKEAAFTAAGFTDTYWAKNGSNKLIPPSAAPDVIATFQQVLANDVQHAGTVANIALGRAAVASYLNAVEYAPNYPLTPDQVIAMFNATYNGGPYNVNGTVSWYAADVLKYFKSLMPTY